MIVEKVKAASFLWQKEQFKHSEGDLSTGNIDENSKLSLMVQCSDAISKKLTRDTLTHLSLLIKLQPNPKDHFLGHRKYLRTLWAEYVSITGPLPGFGLN